MNKSLSTIVVDLTPVLPGGENGGSKIFALELLRRLAEIAPQTRFVLLTQAASHEELVHIGSLQCATPDGHWSGSFKLTSAAFAGLRRSCATPFACQARGVRLAA